jgi:uncharacterized protein YuzE
LPGLEIDPGTWLSSHAAIQIADRKIDLDWLLAVLRSGIRQRRPEAFRRETCIRTRTPVWQSMAARGICGKGKRHSRRDGDVRQNRGEVLMKIRYDTEVDVVDIKLSDAEISQTEEDEIGVFVDLDREGNVFGLEFLNAKDFFSPKAIRQFQNAA